MQKISRQNGTNEYKELIINSKAINVVLVLFTRDYSQELSSNLI